MIEPKQSEFKKTILGEAEYGEALLARWWHDTILSIELVIYIVSNNPVAIYIEINLH